MMNNKLEKIADELKSASNILLFPHQNMDGDALGSCIALCLGLKKIGKNVFIVIDEKVPDNLLFLDTGCTASIASESVPKSVDMSILIDAGEIDRLKSRQAIFESAKQTVCIDHHITSKGECELNYIDPTAAACAEIIFDLLKTVGIDINKKIAEAIYTGIDTDTGRFQYSNTTKRTHEITAELLGYGADQNKISIEIYQSESYNKLKLRNMILANIHLFSEGKAAIAVMTQDMLKKSGALDEDTEGVVEEMRNIKGVEIAALVKELKDSTTKISMRSKEYVDVSDISQKFGGGGHTKAAGFTSLLNADEISVVLKRQIETLLDDNMKS